MAWAYISDDLPSHPKITAAEAADSSAPWLFVAGICHCRRHLTGGFIDKAMVPRLIGKVRPRAVQALLDVGLWVDDGAMYRVHDYAEWNETEDKQKAARKSKASRAATSRWERERERKRQPEA